MLFFFLRIYTLTPIFLSCSHRYYGTDIDVKLKSLAIQILREESSNLRMYVVAIQILTNSSPVAKCSPTGSMLLLEVVHPNTPGTRIEKTGYGSDIGTHLIFWVWVLDLNSEY